MKLCNCNPRLNALFAELAELTGLHVPPLSMHGDSLSQLQLSNLQDRQQKLSSQASTIGSCRYPYDFINSATCMLTAAAHGPTATR